MKDTGFHALTDPEVEKFIGKAEDILKSDAEIVELFFGDMFLVVANYYKWQQ